jgi:hypothetical protein
MSAARRGSVEQLLKGAGVRWRVPAGSNVDDDCREDPRIGWIATATDMPILHWPEIRCSEWLSRDERASLSSRSTTKTNNNKEHGATLASHSLFERAAQQATCSIRAADSQREFGRLGTGWESWLGRAGWPGGSQLRKSLSGQWPRYHVRSGRSRQWPSSTQESSDRPGGVGSSCS